MKIQDGAQIEYGRHNVLIKFGLLSIFSKKNFFIQNSNWPKNSMTEINTFHSAILLPKSQEFFCFKNMENKQINLKCNIGRVMFVFLINS
jgi:hypothetical protein